MSMNRWPRRLAMIFLGCVMAGPVVADDTSMCALTTADGGVDFYGLLTSQPDEARQKAAMKMVKSQGITLYQANQIILECIPPGGTFSDERVQRIWTVTPR